MEPASVRSSCGFVRCQPALTSWALIKRVLTIPNPDEPGSGSFFGGILRLLSQMSSPKNVPDPLPADIVFGP